MQSVIFNQTDSLTRFKEIAENRFFKKYAQIDIEGKTSEKVTLDEKQKNVSKHD